MKVITPINKRAQGSSDAGSEWAQARYQWVTQLLLRLRAPVVTEQDFLDDFTHQGPEMQNTEMQRIEDCFSLVNLPNLSLGQIAWWDEVHKKCWISNCREGAMDHVQFPKDKEGKYDPEGTYAKRPLGGVQLKVKFSQEV